MIDESMKPLIQIFYNIAETAYAVAGIVPDKSTLAARACEMYVLFLVASQSKDSAVKVGAAVLSLVKDPPE